VTESKKARNGPCDVQLKPLGWFSKPKLSVSRNPGIHTRVVHVNDFADESHVLVVYSTDPETVNVYDDWNFQLMMGDNTGNASKGIFTENKTTDLREKLNEYFTARTRYSIGEAVDVAFSEELPSLMKSTIDYGSVFTAIAMLVFIVVHAMFMTGIAEVLYAKKKHKGVVPVSTDSKEYKCPYCGTVYTDEVRRKYGKCQSCGAPFTLEEEPDSTNFEKGNT
jgi:ribosomal protein L37AE/L43A